MKKMYFSFGMIALLVILSSSIYAPVKTSTIAEDFLPPTDSLELDLPDELYDYKIQFPEHILESFGLWGVDTTQASLITNQGATLGRVLFYDVRLSGDNSLSCASCHKQSLSFADDVALSDGIDGQFTTRNSLQLNDLAWQSSFGFFWDMRSFNLSEAVIQPILASHELGKNIPTLIGKLENSEYYPGLFEAAFGSPEITQEGIASALAQFIASMTTFNSKYDQEVATQAGNFTQSEINGLLLFQQNCEVCHFAPHFGASGFGDIFFAFGNNGLDSVFTDLGAGENWGPEYEGVFKGPSLRNIALTAPFMHDGRFETLEEVMDFYSEEVRPNPTSGFNWIFGDTFTGYQFTDTEKEDIIAFMNTLTDEDFITNDKWSNPWSSTVGIQPLPELDGVQVYPNPVNDQFQVEITSDIHKTYTLKLYDVKGQLIQNIQTTDENTQLGRGNRPPGVYQLLVSDGNLSKTIKLIFK